MSTAVVSFYMKNISDELISAQRSVITKLLPPKFSFFQILTSLGHAESLDNFILSTAYDNFIFLDIDCVPLNSVALPYLAAIASCSKLIGCVQRASHIDNGNHLYVGPFCCAFDRTLWHAIGRPSFQATDRGDVGEELTFACEESGRDLCLLWPSAVDEPLWKLDGDSYFGIGTEYDKLFWHAFESRKGENQNRFLRKCNEIIALSF